MAMARTIPAGLSDVLEELELERPELVSIKEIGQIAERVGVGAPARAVASRLKARGWLLETPQRGVWEFAPAETAGPFSSLNPLLPIKAFALANPTIAYALTFQTAAWAMGLADRVPARIEVSFAAQPKVKVPTQIAATVYAPRLANLTAKGVGVLAPEAVVVNMALRPSALRSWAGVEEWLPDVAYDVDPASMIAELDGRPDSVWARTGYLLQGMRPDVSDALRSVFTPRSKIRFGTAGKTIRNDERWMVADATLPFDPREMEPLR